MWVRISEGIDDPPVHGQQVRYLFPSTGLVASIQYVGPGAGISVGYWIFLPAVGRVFDAFASLEEAKAGIDAILQPFYIDLL